MFRVYKEHWSTLFYIQSEPYDIAAFFGGEDVRSLGFTTEESAQVVCDALNSVLSSITVE